MFAVGLPGDHSGRNPPAWPSYNDTGLSAVVHGTLEWELQGGAGDVAIMGSPPAVHATPQLGHHQRTVQAACYGHGRSYLPHTTSVMSATGGGNREGGDEDEGEVEGEEQKKKK